MPNQRQPAAGHVRKTDKVLRERIAGQSVLLGEQLIEPDGHGIAVRDPVVIFAVDISVRH